MGCEAGFYHLTSGRLETVLPRLLQKAQAAGHRIVVRARDGGLLRLLDEQLWTRPPDGFLPHGLFPCDYSDLQPILLTSSESVPNAATLCVMLDPLLPADAARFQRLVLIFDGQDQASVAAARDAWRAAGRIDGMARSYWTQNETGGWQKTA